MIYFFNTLSLQTRVTNILGCMSGSILSVYLGLPLIVKEVTPTFWNTILKRIQRNLARWKVSILSHTSKLQLLTTSLQAILVYFLSIFKIPRYIVEKVEKI